MPVLTAEERVGTTIAGKYQLEGILGQGGFGVVMKGVHEWTGRPIAVKILDHALTKREGFVQRFLREARAAAKLAHPNVVDVLDMGKDADGTVYLVLELLKGEDFADRLERSSPLSLRQTLEYTLPIMDALATAHGHNIIHRDLKPANIFLSRNARRQVVPKLLDFGIAKDTEDGSLSTKTGEVWGTPHYMSPEQAIGTSDIGPDTDVWAMGVVLYECLAGQRPYDHPSTAMMISKLLSTPAPHIHEVAPKVPEAFAAVVMKALAHERAERYPDLGAMLADVIRVAEELDALPDNAAPIVAATRLQRSETVHDALVPSEDGPGVGAAPTVAATPAPGSSSSQPAETPEHAKTMVTPPPGLITGVPASATPVAAASQPWRLLAVAAAIIAVLGAVVVALGWNVLASELAPDAPPAADATTLASESPEAAAGGAADPLREPSRVEPRDEPADDVEPEAPTAPPEAIVEALDPPPPAEQPEQATEPDEEPATPVSRRGRATRAGRQRSGTRRASPNIGEARPLGGGGTTRRPNTNF